MFTTFVIKYEWTYSTTDSGARANKGRSSKLIRNYSAF